MPITWRSCRICTSTRRQILFRLDIGSIVQCTGCDVVSLVDSRTGLLPACEYDERYYNRDRHQGTVGYPDYFGIEQPVRRQVAKVLAGVIHSAGPNIRTLIDVGCGGGYLVHAISQLGVAVVGVDPSSYAIEQARKNGPGRFLAGDVRVAQDLSAFDASSMMDVIEHVPDPVDLVRSVAAIVRPNGWLFILTPRFGGWLLADRGDQYVHFNRDHTYYFTDTTLRQVVQFALPRAQVQILDVADAPSTFHVRSNMAFQGKYTTERDSMLALVRLTGHG